jgi:CO/xanthine dehydrogenase FAD-binding subunit
MKPAPFTYIRPDSMEETLRLLDARGESAKLLAGGQSLVPLLNLRLARVDCLVDIAHLPGLDEIGIDGDGALTIGALVRQRELLASPLVRRHAPLLAECAPLIGHPGTRNRGTVGGSIAHADPAAELPAALLALEATILVTSSAGAREIPAAAFFRDLFTTALTPAELVTAVRIPAAPPQSGWACLELARRHGDFALVGVAAGISLDGDGRCVEARLSLFGVGPTPVRATASEAMLRGNALTPQLVTEAARLAAAPLDPFDDVQASGQYRKTVAAVYAERALARALERAQTASSRAVSW